ncbi:N(G),N(G)-dimethylarginine dimethylaminohydrolase 1-like [Branchiostoma floridae x Branchiostoma belcheri]
MPLDAKMAAAFGRYHTAVVRGIPDSVRYDALIQAEQRDYVDVEKARQEHAAYVQALRDLGLKIVELPGAEDLPDCPFVEDCAVVCNGTALVTRPGHPNRRGEVHAVKKVLEEDLGLEVVHMVEDEATMDGGDVLFTGKEFFVGLSNRTNEAGARILAETFPDYSVTTVPIARGLHLKCFCTMAAPDVMAVGEGPEAQRAWQEIRARGDHKYAVLNIPDDGAANCMFVNGTIMHCAADEFPKSAKTFTSARLEYPRVQVPNKELAKVDGSLTCLSLLI